MSEVDIHKQVWNNSYVNRDGVPVYLVDSILIVRQLEAYIKGRDTIPEVIRVARRALKCYRTNTNDS